MPSVAPLLTEAKQEAELSKEQPAVGIRVPDSLWKKGPVLSPAWELPVRFVLPESVCSLVVSVSWWQ